MSPPYSPKTAALQLHLLDPLVSITRQLGEAQSPVVLINVFTIDPKDTDALLKAWERDATCIKKQPGNISTR